VEQAASIAKNIAAIAPSVAARPSMLSSMLNAFVMPTSQRTASASASQWFDTIVTFRPLDRTDGRRRRTAQPSFAIGCRPDSVVEQARDEDDRASGEDSRSSSYEPRHRADGDRGQDPRGEPGEDADAAEVRRRALVPAILARAGDEALGDRRAKEAVEHERGNRIRDECRGSAHAREVKALVLGRCLVAGAPQGRSYTRWGI
jgi:hypothetical protein